MCGLTCVKCAEENFVCNLTNVVLSHDKLCLVGFMNFRH